jgi:ABC-type amino acid transport substrate-binding protein
MLNWVGLLALVVVLAPLPAPAGQPLAQQAATDRVLKVGTTVAPPFAIKGEDGQWQGIAIQLWRVLASDLGLRFELEERKFQDLLAGVADGSLDVAVAAITVTADREQVVDFTHPFYTTGLGIAVTSEGGGRVWLKVAERFFSLGFLYVLALLVIVLLGAGFLVWLFERHHNKEMFGGGPAKGIASGFWWSAVTMTTVGYGDKAPKTPGGRIVALLWMFISVIILSSFMAAITSTLTLGELGGPIEGLADLPHVRVGAEDGSTSASFLRDQNIRFVPYESTRRGLEAMASKKLDAFVQDAPILTYLVNTSFKGKLQVLPGTFSRQDYGIALTEGSRLREPLNVNLLEYIHGKGWRLLLDSYLKS